MHASMFESFFFKEVKQRKNVHKNIFHTHTPDKPYEKQQKLASYKNNATRFSQMMPLHTL